MILGVFGPRDYKGTKYNNYDYVASILDEYGTLAEIISGGGGGVEQLALRYASAQNIAHEVIPPNIKDYGMHTAFIRRNQEIVNRADVVLILWDGRDDMYVKLMAFAIAKDKPIHVRLVK